MEQWTKKLASSWAMSGIIIGAMHMYGGFVVPLVTQSVLQPIRLFSNPLFQAHVLGWEQPRPFKEAASPLADLAKEWSGQADDSDASEASVQRPGRAVASAADQGARKTTKARKRNKKRA